MSNKIVLPNQNNIKDIVNTIIDNNDAAITIINSVVASVKKISENKNVKELNGYLSTFNTVNNFVNKYRKVVSDIIDTFCTGLPENKTFADILGRVESTDDSKVIDGKAKKVVKYTVVEAAQQLSTIIDSVVETIEKTADMNFGLSAVFKIKFNMLLISTALKDVFKTMVSTFKDLINTNDINTLLGCLVKKPDITNTLIENDILSENDKTSIDKTRTLTEVKSGELGLLDIIAQTFALVGTMNNLKAPGLTKLRFQLFKIGIGFKKVLSPALSELNSIAIKNTENIKNIDKFINGDGNNGVNAGLVSILNKLNRLFDIIKSFKLSLVSFVSISIAIDLFNNIITKIVNVLDNNNLNVLADKDFSKRLTIINSSVESLLATFISLTKISVLSIPLLIGIKFIIKVIHKIVELVRAMHELANTIDEDVIDKLSNSIQKIDEVLKEVKKTAINLTNMIAIASAGIIGMFAVFIFIGSLILFVKSINWLSKYIGEIAEATVQNIKKIDNIFYSLLFAGAAILLLAVITPLLVEALTVYIVPFLGILVLSLGLMWLMLFISSEITKEGAKLSITTAVNLLIIIGAFVLSAFTILMAAKVGEELCDWKTIGYLILGLGVIVLVAAALVALAWGLSALTPVIVMAELGLGQLVLLLGLVMGAGLVAVALGKLNLDFGKYDEKDPSKSTGIMGNTGRILGFTDWLFEKLSENGLTGMFNKKRQALRQGKRTLKQVNKAVSTIKNIANSLHDIQKIELNETAILSKVETIFTFVGRLDDKITEFIKPKVKPNSNESLLEDTFINIGLRIKKRKMRKANRMLNKVEKVITTLNKIGGSLMSINDLNFDTKTQKTITDNLSSIFSFINKLDVHIATFMHPTKRPEGAEITDTEKLSKRQLRKANKKLSKIENIINTLSNISNALNTIKDLDLTNEIDKKTKTTVADVITSNLIKLFGFVNDIEGKVYDFMNKESALSKRQLKTADKKLSKIDGIISSLGNIKTALESIKEFNLDLKIEDGKTLKGAILDNTEKIFLFIESLETKIADFMDKKSTLSNRELKASDNKLSKVDGIISSLGNIKTALESIKDFNLDKDLTIDESLDKNNNNIKTLKGVILDNTEKIFMFIDKLEEKIKSFINDKGVLSTRDINNFEEKLSKHNNIIKTISGITTDLKSINELDFKDGSTLQNEITQNITGAFKTIKTISSILSGDSENGKIQFNPAEAAIAKDVLGYVESLNKSFISIGNADATTVGKNIDNYSKFIGKVSTINVEKVKTVATMFEHMAEFSNSIKGNFDKLAESLSDKLLPVLEDLKEIMSEVPDKLDTGFRNTSASIAATNAAPTKSNIAAQVVREQPGMSKEEVDKLVEARFNERAKTDANGIAAKLDELISMFKGMSSDVAVVKTV